MYTLHFTGIEADKLLTIISVVGNNKADIMNFVVEKEQHSIILSGYHCYIKIENIAGTYFNKEKLEVTEIGSQLSCPWTLTWDYTQYQDLKCQLQFQSDDGEEIVWQSKIFYLKLQTTLGVDGKISSKYPTIITQLEEEVSTFDGRISELEEKTPVTKYYGDFTPTDESFLQIYRRYNEETETPSQTLEIVNSRTVAVECDCNTTRNNVSLTMNTLPDYFENTFSECIDSEDPGFLNNAYTAFFTSSSGLIVCQAIRLGTSKNQGKLELKFNEKFDRVVLKVGKYFNYYNDEYHYDENASASIIIDEEETFYELPESGYREIEVQLTDSKTLELDSQGKRIHLYGFVAANAEKEYYKEKLVTESMIGDVSGISKAITLELRPRATSQENILIMPDLRIKLHNFTEDDIGKSIYLYRRSKKSNTTVSKKKSYVHPANYDSTSTNLQKFGYASLANTIEKPGGENPYTYPAAPDWMPHGGAFQTEFVITPEIINRGYLTIELSRELLTLLMFKDRHKEFDTDAPYKIIGISQRIRFALMENDQISVISDKDFVIYYKYNGRQPTSFSEITIEDGGVTYFRAQVQTNERRPYITLD